MDARLPAEGVTHLSDAVEEVEAQEEELLRREREVEVVPRAQLEERLVADPSH